MDEPQRRRVHAAKAFDYAMKVLIFEDHDAEHSELDYASLFIEEAIGHLNDALADGATDNASV
jgi:hypothetical protein